MNGIKNFAFFATALLMLSCNNKPTNTNAEKERIQPTFLKTLELVINSSNDSIILNKKLYNEKYTFLYPKDSSPLETDREISTPLSDTILKRFNPIVIKKDQILRIENAYALVISDFDGSAMTLNSDGELIDKILVKAIMGNSHIGFSRNFTFDNAKNQFIIIDEETNDGVSGINNKKELLSKSKTVVKVNNKGIFEKISQKEIFRHQF